MIGLCPRRRPCAGDMSAPIRANKSPQNHKRRLPFLIPAADFTERELQDLGLQGTCEVQICRSVGPWSMGTLTKIEHSIQNAYVKCESVWLTEATSASSYGAMLTLHTSDPAFRTFRLHREPILHHVHRRRRRPDPEWDRRRHCRARHPRAQRGHKVEGVYCHPTLAGVHLPDRQRGG